MSNSHPPDKRLATSSAPGQTGPRGTLLIVDDEEGPRQSLRAVFKDDYEVLLAADGPSAIALAREKAVDVAVVDVRLGGMSGIEVLERLKSSYPNINVVIMTAFETTETLRQALRLHACDYFSKPFDISSMRTAVAEAMLRRAVERNLPDDAKKVQALLGECLSRRIDGQISAARGDIYASIIHDINGPLTAISGYVQLMSQRMGDSDNIKGSDAVFIRDSLRTINRQVTNCIEISRRYLSLLRGHTGELPPVPINKLLTDVAHLVRAHPSLQQNRFILHTLAEDMCVRANATDVIQILLNLIVNGLQCASAPHWVEVRASVANQPLDLPQFRDGPEERVLNLAHFENRAPMVAVAVRDNGPGISAELLPKIFEPYFTTKAERQGTGVGLSIVHRLIGQARGLLHMRTRVGEGTTATVYFPG